jgi:hypothetical protein
MLVKLYGRNFRCFRDDFELSMVAADLRSKDDLGRGVIDVKIENDSAPLKLLRCAAIYGANASGKSSVLDAANMLHWLVRHSSQKADPDRGVQKYRPFLLDRSTAEAPTLLGCIVHSNPLKQLIGYELEFDSDRIHREELLILSSTDHLRPLIRRDGTDVSGAIFEQNEANRPYVEGMQQNVTVLSKLAQHGPRDVVGSAKPFQDAIAAATVFQDFSLPWFSGEIIGEATNRFHKDRAYRKWVMDNIMNEADVGIRDVKTKSVKVDRSAFAGPADVELPKERIAVLFSHQGKDPQFFPFGLESMGTKKLFNLASDWWSLANEKRSLFADELDASLHPRLLDALIRAVNHPASQQMRSQLVFATHDTGLLEGYDGKPPALRRDQVYFTDKKNNGASELFALAEFKEDARSVHNIRKRYLGGRYGSLPNAEGISL